MGKRWNPETLRSLTFWTLLVREDLVQVADAWEQACNARDRYANRIEALERVLWFEHYKDVYPNAAINHGDCEACRLLAALREADGG